MEEEGYEALEKDADLGHLSLELDEETELKDDDSFYSKENRDQLLEDDELAPHEAAFMDGYDEAYVE